jgi:putative membrane protein
MSEPKRQHIVAAITQLLQTIRQNWITILVLLFVGSGSDSMFGPLLIIGFAVLGLIGGFVSWWRFTYQVVEGELRINQGIFVRKNLYLSQDRIQVIDISAGIVQRMFGLVSIEVKTAGSTSKEAKIDAISRDEAERLKQSLRSNDSATGEEEVAELTPQKVYHLSYKELLITASTSGNLGIALSIVVGVFSQVDQIIDEERMIAFFESVMPASVGFSLVLSTILFILIISWLLSFFGTLIKYYDFTLTVNDEELHIKRGLFEQKQLTVPFNRIQAIQIKEDLLRQPLGYASVILESAGYGGEQQELNSTTLYPLLKRGEVGNFIQEVVPQYHISVQAKRPPKIAIRRYLLRMVWVSLLIIVPAWLFIPYGIYSLFLIIPALVLGYGQYNDAKIGFSSDDAETLLLQSRLLSRRTAIVKKYRVQSASTQQNPFQRRLNLVTYSLTVTSGSGGQTFTIRELTETMGAQFLEWLSEAGTDNVQSEDIFSLSSDATE